MTVAQYGAQAGDRRQQWREQRLAADKLAMASAMAALVGTVDGRSPTSPWAVTPVGQAWAMVKVLREHWGREDGGGEGAPYEPAADEGIAPLLTVFEAAGIRYRRVSLQGEWWRSSSAPLIGTLREDGRTMALLPVRKGYVAFDPANGVRRRIDGACAAAFEGIGLQVYPPLDASGISGRALLCFVVRGAGRDLVTLVLAGLGTALLTALVSLFTGRLLFAAAGQNSMRALITPVLLVAVGAVASALLMLVHSAAYLRIEGRLQDRLESALWGHLLALPLNSVSRYSTGDLVQRLNAVATMRRNLGEAAVGSLFGLLFSLSSFVVLFAVDWRLAVSAFGTLVAVLALMCRFAIRQQRHELIKQDLFGSVQTFLYSCLLGIDKIRVAGRESRVFERWAWLFARQRAADTATFKEQSYIAALSAGTQPLLLLSLVGCVVYWHKGVSLFAFFIAVLILGQLGAVISQLQQALAAIFSLLPLLERIRPLLEAAPERAKGALPPGLLTGRVELSGVTFSYPGGTGSVLDRVSMTFAPGEFVAVVGPSGSGKSTLVRLLLGFDRPDDGRVVYDAHDLATLDVRLVRRQIGTVLQQVRVLRGTILENITSGASGATEEDAWNAADDAGLADDIRALPMGMHTSVGEDSMSFSGGQLQRLVLARALARRPRLLILDEATSALDNAAQRHVRNRIGALAVTRVVIAHRLSTIRRADRIYVLEAGRVTACGTYDELRTGNGWFSRMVRRQEA